MINSIKTRTPILALILFVFAVGYTVATTNKVVVIPMAADAAPPSLAVFASGNQIEPITTVDEILRTVTINVPSQGVILANASGYFKEMTGNPRCSIVKDSASIDGAALIIFDGSSTALSYAPFGGTRGFSVTEAGIITINLVCDTFTGTATVDDSQLTALFTPSP